MTKILWSRKGEIKIMRTENMCSQKHKYKDGCCAHPPNSDCHIIPSHNNNSDTLMEV